MVSQKEGNASSGGLETTVSRPGEQEGGYEERGEGGREEGQGTKWDDGSRGHPFMQVAD